MNREQFGLVVKSLRNEQFDPVEGKHWTQKNLAAAAGLPVKVISNIERGVRTRLQADEIGTLAQSFQLTTLNGMNSS